jgi:hypothetical protein
VGQEQGRQVVGQSGTQGLEVHAWQQEVVVAHLQQEGTSGEQQQLMATRSTREQQQEGQEQQLLQHEMRCLMRRC